LLHQRCRLKLPLTTWRVLSTSLHRPIRLEVTRMELKEDLALLFTVGVLMPLVQTLLLDFALWILSLVLFLGSARLLPL
jgi:hypothetical protein